MEGEGRDLMNIEISFYPLLYRKQFIGHSIRQLNIIELNMSVSYTHLTLPTKA